MPMHARTINSKIKSLLDAQAADGDARGNWGGRDVIRAVVEARDSIGTMQEGDDPIRFLHEANIALCHARELLRFKNDDDDGYGAATLNEIRRALVSLAADLVVESNDWAKETPDILPECFKIWGSVSPDEWVEPLGLAVKKELLNRV